MLHDTVTPAANTGVLPFNILKSQIPTTTYTFTEAYLCGVFTNDNSKGCAVSIITWDANGAYCGVSSYYGSSIKVFGIWLLK